MTLEEIKDLKTGMVFWADGFGTDFTLADLIDDWYSVRFGPFHVDVKMTVDRIFTELLKSIPSPASERPKEAGEA